MHVQCRHKYEEFYKIRKFTIFRTNFKTSSREFSFDSTAVVVSRYTLVKERLLCGPPP